MLSMVDHRPDLAMPPHGDNASASLDIAHLWCFELDLDHATSHSLQYGLQSVVDIQCL
jgi:hypothetical protein